MKTRKIFAMVLALCMIITTFAAITVTSVSADTSGPAFSDTEGTPYADAVNVLHSLGLVAGYEDGTFGGDKIVTRAEMAAFVVRELGLEAAAKANKSATKYTDVASDHWAVGYINVATTKGIIVGMGDGTFHPDETVTYQQAVKMMVCALGYQVVANRNGGWPSGYLIQGAAIGVTDGISDISGTDGCNRGNVSELMFNSLEINLMEEVSYSGSAVQVEETTKTFLYDNLGVVRLYDAEIKATETQGESKTNKGEAKVSGSYDRYDQTGKTVNSLAVLTGNTNPDDFFGNAVIIYYKENEGNAKPTMLCILNDGSTQETKTINVSDFYSSNFLLFNGESNAAGTNNSKYVKLYYKTEADTTAQYVNLLDSDQYSTACQLVVNGVVDNNPDWTALRSLKNGTIKLVDAKSYDVSDGKSYAGSDGIYEKVIVNTYNDYVISEIDPDNFEITATNDTSFKLDENKIFKIQDKDGKAMKFEDLQENDVLSIYADVIDADKVDEAETMTIVVSRNVIEGKITEITSKNIYVDGEKYKVAGDLSIADFDLDDEGSFYLNAAGDIVYSDTAAASKDYAVFYDVYQDSSRKMIFNLLTSKGEDLELSATSAVDVVVYGTENGVYGKLRTDKYDFTAGQMGEATTALATNVNGNYKPYIASYTLKSGSETQIDTIYLAGDCSDATSYKSRFGLWAEDISAYYNSAESTLGSYSIDSSTVIFDIPVSVTSSADSNKIKVIGKSGLTNNKTYDDVSVYEVDKNFTAKAVLIKSSATAADVEDPIAVIQSITTSKNADGDTVYKVYMVQNGKVISKLTDELGTFDNYGTGTTANGYTQYSLDIGYGFYPGAAIIFSENSEGAIEDLIKIYPTTSTTGNETDQVPYYRNGYFTTWNNSEAQGSYSQGCDLFIAYGQVTSKNTTNKTITVNTNYKTTTSSPWQSTSYTAGYGSANVTVVDYAFDGDEDRVQIGSASDIKVGSYVLVRKKGGSTKDIVVYKDSFNPDEYVR